MQTCLHCIDKGRDNSNNQCSTSNRCVVHAGVIITTQTNLDGEGEVIFLVLIQKVSWQDNLLAGLSVLSGRGGGGDSL